MKYKVVFNHPSIQRHFEKELSRFSLPVQEEVMKAVLNLANEPRPHGVTKVKPPLDIFHHLAQYRVRVRNCRIFYDVDDKDKVVSIIALRKRDEQTYH